MDNIDVVTRQEEKEICVSMRLRLRKAKVGKRNINYLWKTVIHVIDLCIPIELFEQFIACLAPVEVFYLP